MKLSPQQAPLYGRCVITVQLTEEELALADDQHKYFLLFSGSTKRHLTSTQRSGHDALQALCPAHDCCEAVLVTLCSISPASDHYVDHVTPVAEQRFCFVQDLAFDMAQFLVSTAGRSDGLEGALLLDECHIPLRECERLDESLALALHHLALPPGWSLLGSTLSNSTDMDPQETLLHFSARRGLSQVTQFLLQQPGAKEALQLTNKQGFTPAAIAASKGHHCVHELFIRAEKDIEACNQTEPVQLVSTDAQLVCHLPRLNTHTLTLSIVPGRDPPSLQRGVEQLLHLICHLHAKGVSSLELQSDSLHTAAECCEDIDTEITSVEQQHTATAPECLEKRKQESGNENCFSRNSQSSADCGHDENGNSETDWGLCSWTPEVGKAEEPGLSSSQNWVCPASHSGSDYQRAEEEGRQWPVCSTHSVCDSSGAHEETVCVGTVPRAACGKQAEDTDTRDTGIQEGQEATEGRERSELETVGRPDRTHGKEETKSAEQITSSELTTVSIMGQSPSTDCSDMSDTSDCEVNCSHKEEEDTVESSVREEKQEDNEELTNFSGALGDQSPLLTDSGDVITACDSAFPSFLIEGLHYEGEPPPHTNSLEQNQETAGMDYAQEQQWGLSPETQCHSGNCSEISTAEEYVQCTEDTSAEVFHNVKSTDSTTEELNNLEETSCQTVPDAGASPADQPELIHVTSSDDDNSFQSVGSTTDIFDPTVQAQSEELSSTGVRTETSLVESCDTDSLTVDVELPSDSPIVNPRTVPDCSQTGTAPGHQLSPHSLTMEPLIVEAKGGKLTSDQCREELLEELENCVSSAIKADDSESTFNSSDKYVFTENSTSELERDSEDRALIKSKCDMKSLQNWETSTNESKVTLVATEGMPHSGNTTTLFTSQATAFSDDLEDMSTRTCSVTSESHCEGVFLLHSSNCTDEVSKAQNSPEQEYTEGDDTSVENTSLIHRDREATHGPYNSLQSESVQSFVLPTRSNSVTSCPSTYHRNSANDLESFMTAESGSDGIFKRIDEPLTGGDSISELSVSCSSTDDTASLGPSSSSPEESHGLGCHWSPEESIKAGPDTPDSAAGDAEEEAKDRVTEVPRRSCLLRNSPRSISPLRRHSWGPGKNCTGDVEMNRRALRRSGQQKATFYRRSERGCPHRGPCGGSVKLVSPLSYSLEGLSGVQEELRGSSCQSPQILEPSEMPHNDCDGRSSLMSLTENPVERVQLRRLDKQKSQRYRPMRNSCPPMTLPLTKSVSMLAISHRDIDGMRPFSCTSASLAYSISEEEPGPLRPDMEEKNLTKVGRTFSYLKSKMYKKTREKEREKNQKETKEKDKKSTNGHVFNLVGMSQSSQCSQCNKTFSGKEAYLCTYCNASVHKGCRDSLPVCSKVKMKLPKQQLTLPDSSSFPTVTMRNKTGATRERPWSAILSPEDSSSLIIPSRRHASLMFHGNNLSKNEMPIRTLRYLSQSTDSLNRTNPVTESMESLTDEGTEMMDGQLMGEFEADAKDLEVDSWSFGVDQQFLQQLDKDLVKRQDIIYELMQTELHHIRTLRIMSEVYSKGLQKELQLETPTLDRLFPALEDLSELHSHYLLRLLERRRGCQQEGGAPEGTVIIHNIGDIVLSQFSGSSGENMKRVYGKFCSCHNEAVNFYKDLLTKDKRFKTFIKRKMSSSIVRRLGIPECILLVTQRITKYPVLLQRLLHHTKEGNEEHEDLTEALRLVKEVITAVDGKVNEHDKRRRLKDFHSRMDTKSIMMMKSGQIFAREDLLRRRLIHDGPLQLKSSQGRLKDVHALLLTDVFVFLHEKDQKYVFAMLDQRSTVISLQKLIVREVANEERGLFLITAGIEKPEMMEVLASSKDERNSWMQRIQDAMQSMDKDEDEGIPSETEDDKRQLETKAREMRDLLKQKDTEILSLLEEKVRLFRGMWEGLSSTEETCHQVGPFFRSDSSQEPPRGAAIMKDALLEVETLQALVSGSLGGAMASIQAAAGGPVCLPRRAETFGGFDSHQMLSNKSAAKDENLDTAGDLRRTGSDSVLKKGGNANLLHMLKRNSEQLLRSVSHLHLLLSSLQAVVVQQDSFIEDQRQALSERSSSGSSLSRPSSRPGSLIEQEKQRSLEKQRQELTSLHRQQAAHADERRKREKEWEQREQQIADKESLMHVQEEEILQQHNKMEQEKQELQNRKEEYQKDLERLRDAQRKLERDRETVQRQLDRMEELRLSERTPSTTSDDSQLVGSSQSLELEPMELSSVPSLRSKSKGKGLNPFTSSSTNASCKNSDANNQLSKGLLQLAKNKSKESKDRDKKKKKGKGAPPADGQQLQEAPLDGEIFFC